MLTFNQLARHKRVFAVGCGTPAGRELYYTGKAGAEYLSSDINKAFPFQTLEGADRKAAVLQQGDSSVIWFVRDSEEDGE